MLKGTVLPKKGYFKNFAAQYASRDDDFFWDFWAQNGVLKTNMAKGILRILEKPDFRPKTPYICD